MRDVDSRLEEITELYNYRLYYMADKRIDALYEEYTADRIKMNEYQEEWMFNLIDMISTTIYG